MLLLFLPFLTFFLGSIRTCNIYFFFGWPIVPGGEPVMDTGDWRIQLRPDSRKRIVDKMYVQVLQNSNFFIYMKEKENDKGLIKISRIAMRQDQVSHTSFFLFHLFMGFS